MNNFNLSTASMCGISGLIGCAIGVVGAIFALKNKYKKEAEAETEEEIERIREVYRSHIDNGAKKGKVAPTRNALGKNDPNAYRFKEVTQFDMKSFQKTAADISRQGRYTSPVPIEKIDEPENDCRTDVYAISKSEFGDDHSKVFLTYFNLDKTLVDDAGDTVAITKDDEGHDILSIPEEILEHVGEEEDDIVYCRNDMLGIDYEITFVDMASTDIPRPSEVRYE